MSTRIVLVDDHAVFRQGLMALLGAHPEFQVVGEASDASNAYTTIEEQKPDLVTFDLGLPGESGVPVLREIQRRNRSLKLLIVSAFPAEYFAAGCFEAGASGYISKTQRCSDLLEAIRTVASGKSYAIQPSLLNLVERMHQESTETQTPPSPLDELSHREREVFELVALGHSNSQVAEKLLIHRRTAETHRANLMRKLGVHSIAGLVRLAAQHRLL